MPDERRISNKQKMEFIKRNIDILTEEQNKMIYRTIRRSVGMRPIRDSGSTGGIYIDLEEIKDDVVLDMFYMLVKKRKEDIKI